MEKVRTVDMTNGMLLKRILYFCSTGLPAVLRILWHG